MFHLPTGGKSLPTSALIARKVRDAVSILLLHACGTYPSVVGELIAITVSLRPVLWTVDHACFITVNFPFLFSFLLVPYYTA